MMDCSISTVQPAGPHHNETLLGKVLKGRRSEVVIATKFGLTTHSPPNGKPEYVRECVEASLKRLQTDYIDLYYQHRHAWHWVLVRL